MAVDAEIEQLAARRHAIWASGSDDPTELQRIASRLTDLYEMKRQERCRTQAGVARADVIRQARVESELERLMAAS